jgi:hypothetical protein
MSANVAETTEPTLQIYNGLRIAAWGRFFCGRRIRYKNLRPKPGSNHRPTSPDLISLGRGFLLIVYAEPSTGIMSFSSSATLPPGHFVRNRPTPTNRYWETLFRRVTPRGAKLWKQRRERSTVSCPGRNSRMDLRARQHTPLAGFSWVLSLPSVRRARGFLRRDFCPSPLGRFGRSPTRRPIVPSARPSR